MVTVQLSDDAALVLFELLARHEENLAQIDCAHRAEEHALAQVLGALQRTLVEPFEPDYDEHVAKARAALLALLGD